MAGRKSSFVSAQSFEFSKSIAPSSRQPPTCSTAQRRHTVTALVAAAASAAVALTICANSTPAADAASARVLRGEARVVDGDTLIVSGKRVRLKAVDAPELAQVCVDRSSKRELQCGVEAKIASKSLIERSNGFVECVGAHEDRYGRLVAKCSAGDDDIGSVLVSRGFAVAYRQYGHDYVDFEEKARLANRGVWGTKFDMPWEWRKTHKHHKK